MSAGFWGPVSLSALHLLLERSPEAGMEPIAWFFVVVYFKLHKLASVSSWFRESE